MSDRDTDSLDARIRTALRELGAEAPPFRRMPSPDSQPRSNPERPAHRSLAPVLGIAAAVAVITVGVAVATWSTGPDQNSGAESGAPAGEPSTGQPTSAEETSSPAAPSITLAAMDGWTVQRPNGCAAISGPTDHVVFELDAFELACLSGLDRSGTSVFVMPLPEELLGQNLTAVTSAWPGVLDGHELRRLTAGTLAELSSVYADGVACMDCDRLIVVTGPDPAQVRSIVESVRPG